MKILFFLLLPLSVQAQGARSPMEIEKNVRFRESSVYMVCRGTKSKQGMVARAFNLSDTLSTHVGIGLLRNGRFRIYHVADQAGNAFRVDSISSYITEACSYISIWEARLPRWAFIKAVALADHYSGKHIVFDYRFQTRDDDTLYCSEFCFFFLRKLDRSVFRFTLSEKWLDNPFYRSFLGLDVLRYLPVDFFQPNERFKKVYELKF